MLYQYTSIYILVKYLGDEDYLFSPTNFTFGPESSDPQCVNIILVESDEVEDTELFTYTFFTFTDRVIVPPPDNVSIVDPCKLQQGVCEVRCVCIANCKMAIASY